MEQSLRERVAKLKYNLVEYRWCDVDYDTGEHEEYQSFYESLTEEEQKYRQYDPEKRECYKDLCYGKKLSDDDIQWDIVPNFENSLSACWELIEELNKKYGVKNIPIYESKTETCEGVCREYLWYKE